MKASLAGVGENIAAIQDFLGAQVKISFFLLNFLKIYSYLSLLTIHPRHLWTRVIFQPASHTVGFNPRFQKTSSHEF